MSHSSYQSLLNRGRKAGLNTNELYRVLATRPPEAHEASNRVGDGNGFVYDYQTSGRRVYRPMQGQPRA